MRKHKWVLGLGLIVFLMWGSMLVGRQLCSMKHACAFESLWGTVSDRRVPAPDRKHFEKLSKIANKRIKLFLDEKYELCKTYESKRSIEYFWSSQRRHRFLSRKRELLKRKYGVERHSQVRIVGICRPPLRAARKILFLYGLLDSIHNDLPKYTEKEGDLYRRTAFLEIKANGKAFLEVWIWDENDWKALDLPVGVDTETIRRYLYDAGTEPWASLFVELSEQRTK